MRFAAFAAVAVLLWATSVAHGQSAPPTAEKRRAQVLMTEGVRLLEAKDYAGAIEMFESAYALFPSVKVLLNIGTTLLEWKKPDEAANTYQRYLDSAEADPAQVVRVSALVGDLDRTLGSLEITTTPAGAEVKIDGGTWRPAAAVARWRVLPGPHTLVARHQSRLGAAVTVDVAAGASVAVTLATEVPEVAIAEPPEPPRPAPPVIGDDPHAPSTIGARGEVARQPRVGAYVRAAIDPGNRGAAFGAGATVTLFDRVAVAAGGQLGEHPGAYLGVVGHLTRGSLRPLLAAGIPMVWSDGVRLALRGAGGLEWVASSRLSLVAEAGVEHFFAAEPGIVATVFIPVVGVHVRL